MIGEERLGGLNTTKQSANEAVGVWGLDTLRFYSQPVMVVCILR